MENILKAIKSKNGKSKLIIKLKLFYNLIRDYLNYKSLKQLIKETVKLLFKENEKEKVREFQVGEEITIKSPTNSAESGMMMKNDNRLNFDTNIGNQFEGSNGINDREKLIDNQFKKFIKQLDTEIKKIYLFFVTKERELYVSINSHLHIRQTFQTFDLRNIEKEFEELYNISYLTYNITKFIHLNMMAIKKILKKFDRNFEELYGRISLKYIQRKIECKNSDLLYVLHFKIIDEVSALLEDLVCDLKLKFEDRRKNVKKVGDMSTPLVNSNVLTLSEDFSRSDQDVINRIMRYFDQLQMNLYLIDENSQNFRSTFKEWNTYLKQNSQIYGNTFINNPNTSFCGVSTKDKEYVGYDSISNSREPKFATRKISLDSNYVLSEDNIKNINLTLFHTFFFMFSFSLFLPTNIFYIKNIGYNPIFSGLIMAMTPIGTITSMFYTNRWIKSSFKQPILISSVFFILGHILYVLSHPTVSMIPMGIGRFLIGLGNNRIVNRNYIVEYIPKNKLSKYLLYYQISSLAGLAFGPLFSIPLIYFDNFGFNSTDIFNNSTNPAILCIIISIILLILIIITYTEPNQSNFTVYSFGQSFSDNGSSNSSRQTLSKADKEIIEQIDDKLSIINEKNKFSDTNLVSSSIEQIAWKEKKTASYLYKCFFVFTFIMTISRLTIESLLVISPFYITHLKDDADIKLVALLMSAALLLVIPASFLISHYLNTKIRDRRMMVYLIATCIVFNILIVNFLYASLIQYCIVFVFLIISTSLLESVATMMFSKIIPSDYVVWKMNAGFLIQVMSTLGKVFGALMLTFAGFSTDENLNRIAYGITLGLFLVGIVLSLLYYSELRVKAIARILRVKTYRKLKTSEF